MLVNTYKNTAYILKCLKVSTINVLISLEMFAPVLLQVAKPPDVVLQVPLQGVVPHSCQGGVPVSELRAKTSSHFSVGIKWSPWCTAPAKM
jgi:hypothetical protein